MIARTDKKRKTSSLDKAKEKVLMSMEESAGFAGVKVDRIFLRV